MEKNSDVSLVITAIMNEYGYDFSSYSEGIIYRRLDEIRSKFKFQRIASMIPNILEDKEFFNIVLENLTINYTSFFRDPSFFKSFQKKVIPEIKNLPSLKFWHPGCSTGEEAYSTAIILSINNMIEKSLIYSTDINFYLIEEAKKAIYNSDDINIAEANFSKIYNNIAFQNFYNTAYGKCKIKRYLTKKITFAVHDLVQDKSFGEMNVIMCRNVLIYFDSELKNRVLKLFVESLAKGGYLCLGKGETISNTDIDEEFERIDLVNKIYRKK